MNQSVIRLLLHQRHIRRLILRKPLGGEDQETVLLTSYEAALRRPQNWILPGMLGLSLLFLLVGSASVWGPLHPIPRIILVDYFVLLLGFIGGANVARGKRANPEHIEELVIAPLHPSTVATLFFASSFAPWVVVLAGIAVFEALIYTFFNGLFAGMLSLVAYLFIALFHFETLRIANSFLLPLCLPGGVFRGQLIPVVIMLGLTVFGLTATGSAITGLCFAFGAALAQLAEIGNLAESMTFWFVGAIPGLIVVLVSKRLMARQFERAFWSRYLMYVAWGAADTDHPAEYPAEFRRYAASHVAQM